MRRSTAFDLQSKVLHDIRPCPTVEARRGNPPPLTDLGPDLAALLVILLAIPRGRATGQGRWLDPRNALSVETFSPASSGSVHNFTTASRAELA